MKFFWFAVAGAVVIGSGCGRGEDPAVGTRQDEIIGGTVAMGDPSVVALVVGYGGRFTSYCTGALIGPKTVLTAAHCVNAQGRNAPYSIAFGTVAASPTSTVRVVNQVRHPMYSGTSNDVGVLQLERAVTTSPILRLNERALTTAMVGLPVRHVGFGVTNGTTQAGGGTKREISTPLRRVMSSSFESGAVGRQTCQGDSGGPAFMVMPGDEGESLVGVVSYGDQGCQQFGVDMRVDQLVPWIRSTAARWEEPTCEVDGLCKAGCTPIDQDCACAQDGVCSAECADLSRDKDCPIDCVSNGVCAVDDCPRPDVDCVNEGGLCSAPTQCRGRQCVDDAQNKDTYCSRTCSDTADCIAPMSCIDGACRLPLRPERQPLESCTPVLDFCVTSTCNGPRDGITRCVSPCTATADCASGSICEGGTMGGKYCRPLNVDFQPKRIAAIADTLGAPPKSGCVAAPGGLMAGLVLMGLFRRRRQVCS